MEMVNESVRHVTLNSCKELIDYFLFQDVRWNEFIFRGESSSKYKLLPTVLRPELSDKLCEYYVNQPILNGTDSDKEVELMRVEYHLLRKFYLEADKNGLYLPPVPTSRISKFYDKDPKRFDENELWIPSDLYEVAALAQHHGIPTRLIDWSTDFFVAMYFACTGAINRYCKNPNKFDYKDQLVIWAMNAEKLTFYKDKIELNIITPPYHGNPNLNAQSGVFSLVERKRVTGREDAPTLVDRTPLDELIYIFNICGPMLLLKIQIPIATCFEMKTLLNKMGYNSARLFPGYDGVVRMINEQAMRDKYVRKFYTLVKKSDKET